MRIGMGTRAALGLAGPAGAGMTVVALVATALAVAAAFLLSGPRADARPDEPEVALEVLLALKALGLEREEIVVRDVEFWERWAPRLRTAGRMAEDVRLPAVRDPRRPEPVDLALRRPLDAVGIAITASQFGSMTCFGLVTPTRPKTPPLGKDPIPIDVEVPAMVRDFARALAFFEDVVADLLPEGSTDSRMDAWLRDGVPAAEVGEARAAFGRFASTELAALRLRAHALVRYVELRIGDEKPKGFPRRELLRIETSRGLVLVGTKKKDVYEEDAWLVVDPGGNDRWTNNAGGTAGGHRAALAVDIAGNDRYESERPFVQGAGRDGVGLLVDAVGNDVYRAATFAQGVAVGGVGMLLDRRGGDTYEAKEFAQGAAAFGFGILSDLGYDRSPKNDDTYTLDRLGQGLGRTQGWGVLQDWYGDDHYVVRPVHESVYSEWTGGRTVHWSFAQGCGLGFYNRYEESLPDGSTGLVIRDLVPGGVGFLSDAEGDDVYEGSMYAQGTGYFYGLGVLVDRSGNDRYTCTWYGQGAAPHFACGILVDGGGNDHYEGLHQVQGSARDFATAVFVDMAGDDTYVGEDRVQGCGDQRDAWGLFVDAEGDDHYLAKRRSARGWTTLVKPEEQPSDDVPYTDHGVFLDLGGTDVYEGKAAGADGTTWIQKATGRGIGIDR